MHTRKLVSFAALGLMAGACSSDTPVGSQNSNLASEGRLKIEVAPQEMEGDHACYEVTVQNSEGVVVWHEAEICTDEFGHGPNGSLTYVGICDAAAAPNAVTIKLNSLSRAGEDLSNWDEAPTFIDDNVVCSANADTRVRATFFVLVQGEKGFLDISVEVESIACNAKVDCVDDFLASQDSDDRAKGRSGFWFAAWADRAGKREMRGAQGEGTPDEEPKPDDGATDADTKPDDGSTDEDEKPADDGNTDADNGQDDQEEPPATGDDGTIIVGITCESRDGDNAQIHADDLSLTCKDAAGMDVSVDIDLGGNGWHDGYPNEYIFGVLGNSGVTADGQTSFWTTAIGVSSGWTDCRLNGRWAVTAGNDMDGAEQYPIIVANDIEFGFDDAGVFSCDANPLDGEGSGLETSWGDSDDLSFDSCLSVQVDAAGAASAELGACAE